MHTHPSFLQTHTTLKLSLIGYFSGALSILGLAPFHYPIMFLLGFSIVLYLLECSRTKKQLFLTGWSYGFGYFTCGLYWIANALYIDIAKWWWLLPFALIGLPFVLSFFYGFAGLAVYRFKHNALSLAIAAAISFSIFEFLRGHLFTGFPWNLSAYIWMDTPISQSLSWLGAYGLSFITFLIAGLFYALKNIKKQKASQILFMLCIVIFSVSFALGKYIESTPAISQDRATRIMVVQPNIAQKDKWQQDKQEENLETLISLSKPDQGHSDDQDPDLIIWPETAITYEKDDIKTHLSSKLKEILAPGQVLISGVLDVEHSSTDPTQSRFYNALIVTDASGEVLSQYNKHHLVPFGEYVPFRNILSFGPIAQALSTTGDFSAGDGLKTIHTFHTSFSPLICYEVIFPRKSIAANGTRPQFLLNITNDAWYGDSTGPHQHLAISRARAIETGLPVVRVAGTGISAMINSNGQVLHDIALNTAGSFTADLPQPKAQTIYTTYKEWPFFIIMGIFMAFLLIIRRSRGKN